MLGVYLGALVTAAGCAHLNYHLVEIPNDVVLVPPRVNAPNGSQYGTFRVSFPDIVDSSSCGFEAGNFSAHSEDNALVLTAREEAVSPTTGAVSLQPGITATARQILTQHLDSITSLRNKIEDMEAAGCFSAAQETDPLLKIMQSAPFASSDLESLLESSISVPGYRELRAGERLSVVAPLIDEQQVWRGATTLSYDLIGAPDGRIEIRLPAGDAVNVVRDGTRLRAQALDLPPQPTARYLRMVTSSRNLQSDWVNYLIGAPDIASMRASIARIEEDGGGCDHVTAPVWCAAPKYGTVINVEVMVWVQGKLIGIHTGHTVRDAIQEFSHANGSDINADRLEGLQILRPYGGQLIPVSARTSNLLLGLGLLGGEHVSWKDRR